MALQDDIDTLVARLQTVATKSEAIKSEIEDIAEAKDIAVEESVDTPISVLQKIDNGTIKTPTGTLNISGNNTYDVTNYASAVVNVPSSFADVAKGLADGTLTSFSAPALGVTSLKSERFRNFTSLQSLDLTGIIDIPAYTADGCTGLTSIVLNNPVTNVGDYAFNSSGNSNITHYTLTGNNATMGQYAFSTVLGLEKIAGSFGNISKGAFYQCTYLKEVDATINGTLGNDTFNSTSFVEKINFNNSNITDIGNYAFGSFGNRRSNPSTNILNFNFKNSTFTTIYSNTFSGSSSYHQSYCNIYLPSTLTSISGTYAFRYSDYINIYYNSVPSLSNTNNFANTTNIKNFFPYNLVQTAKTSTNWSSSTNNIVSSIYGYAEENTFSLGDTLPDTDADGYALTWYSDSAMTMQVTTVADPTQMYYCSVGSQIKTPLAITEYQATCTLSDGVNTYTNGDLVPIGATVTITAVGDTGYPDPYTFTLNGTAIASGDTYTATSTPIEIVCIYYDGVNPPVDPVFSNNTPQQVKIAVDNGLHRTLWNIGDTRVITLTNNQQVTMRYIDQVANRYQKSDLSGYTNAVFEFTTLPMTAQMNTSGTNAGGWPASRMCTTTMPNDIWPLLPSDWQAVFSQSRIPSAQSGNSSTIVYADNYAFIPSGQEMYGNTYVNNYYYDEGCTQFDYYRINSANSYKIKQYNGSNFNYWLRSPSRSSSNGFWEVNADGSISGYYAINSFGVSVCLPI